MQHTASDDFWSDYDALPVEVRNRADKQFELLKSNPYHPSLHFKKVSIRNGQEIWSVRINLRYRALAIKNGGSFLWFWVGDHADYDAKLT